MSTILSSGLGPHRRRRYIRPEPVEAPQEAVDGPETAPEAVPVVADTPALESLPESLQRLTVAEVLELAEGRPVADLHRLYELEEAGKMRASLLKAIEGLIKAAS